FSLRDVPVVADVRGYGMFGAVDVQSEGAPGKRGHALQKKLFDSGLHLKATGDSAIVAPPLIAERAHIDNIIDIMRRTLRSI
ncbi:MAG: aminotransferase class III-fold pyridoxal phosphate-dependent enzyme, partial [Pseudomonadota bacterium]|nr:aminotransferase class III-fold pyridoxal phosphate-dependent enzyme [Pseudomonadota bacterium]